MLTTPLTSADFKDLERRSGKAADLLKALGNRERLVLLCSMLGGELCVSELQIATGIEQPTLSQQLAVLRRQALVRTRREGKQIHYSIADPAVVRVLETLHGIFCAPARRRAATPTKPRTPTGTPK